MSEPPWRRVEWRQTKGSQNFVRWPFEFKIIRERTYIYKQIGQQAQELRRQGLSWRKVGRKLGVSDKWAKRAALAYQVYTATEGLTQKAIRKETCNPTEEE
jgi:hypothetical protein